MEGGHLKGGRLIEVLLYLQRSRYYSMELKLKKSECNMTLEFSLLVKKPKRKKLLTSYLHDLDKINSHMKITELKTWTNRHEYNLSNPPIMTAVNETIRQ